MPEILTANIGSYPRIGEEKDQHRHRRGRAHFERKDISAHAFRDVEQSVVQEIIREQLLCGMDQVTDGQIAWMDPISHLCQNVSGIEITGLTRYFNTNFYYRVPFFTAKPRVKQATAHKEFAYAQSISSKPVRAVITGPITLASHSESEVKSLNKVEDRIIFFAELIQREVEALAGAGASVIQIDEPSLAQNPSLMPAARKALEQITSRAKSKIVLALYFFPLAPLWKDLQNLSVHGLNLDFTSDTEALTRKLMDSPSQKEIGFGIVDARNTIAESPEELAQKLRPMIEKHSSKTCVISPSAGLELLPRRAALEKLSTLTKTKAALNA